MDVGKCFRDAWGLFKLDLGPLAVTALIAAVIVGIVNLLVRLAIGGGFAAVGSGWLRGLAWGSAFGATLVLLVVSVVVYGWMCAVTFRMVLRRVREQRAAQYGDLQELDQIGPFTVAAVVLGIVVGIGYLLLVIPGLILTTLWLYALPLIGDRRLSVSEGMTQSRELAAGPGYMTTFATWLVGAIVLGVVVGLLSIIPVIGVIIGLLAAPFAVAYVVSMYFQVRGEGHLVDAALARTAAGGSASSSGGQAG